MDYFESFTYPAHYKLEIGRRWYFIEVAFFNKTEKLQLSSIVIKIMNNNNPRYFKFLDEY